MTEALRGGSFNTFRSMDDELELQRLSVSARNFRPQRGPTLSVAAHKTRGLRLILAEETLQALALFGAGLRRPKRPKRPGTWKT
jgi:hypothetical protein